MQTPFVVNLAKPSVTKRLSSNGSQGDWRGNRSKCYGPDLKLQNTRLLLRTGPPTPAKAYVTFL